MISKRPPSLSLYFVKDPRPSTGPRRRRSPSRPRWGTSFGRKVSRGQRRPRSFSWPFPGCCQSNSPRIGGRGSQVRHLMVTHVDACFHRKPCVRQSTGSCISLISLRPLVTSVTFVSLVSLRTLATGVTLQSLRPGIALVSL